MTRRTVQNYCAPVDAWPTADQACWQIALRDSDPLDPAIGYARRWKSSTLITVWKGYGRWIGWLQSTDQLEPNSLPASRPTETRLRAYLQALQAAGLSNYTVANHIQQLGNALRAMAPDGDWRRILLAAARIRSRAVTTKDLNARMQPPETILQLGLDLMARAETVSDGLEAAVLFRDGLLVALLVHRPLRVANVAQIEIEGHLHRRNGDWWMTFEGLEMKNGRSFEFSWPSELARPLDRYLAAHREVLLKQSPSPAQTNALWLTAAGGAMTPARVSERIVKRTAARFGNAINPHTFRHIAGTAIATTTPENITDVARVLGHSSLRTSEKHYIRSRMVDAGRAYQATVDVRRKRSSSRGSADRRNIEQTEGISAIAPVRGSAD